MPTESCDVLVIGAGPAGLTAALYAARARLSTVVLERAVPGGQIATTNDIENYPGFARITGPELTELMQKQAESFGARLEFREATGLRVDGLLKYVDCGRDKQYEARTVIVASGSQPRKLGVPGEERLAGRGVSYCATCDGAFFQDRVVAVVGGGDSAFQEGVFLTRYASKVILIHRRDQFRASTALVLRGRANPKMEFVLDTVVEEILGDGQVEAVRIRNVKTGEVREIAVQGVFPYIGLDPNSGFLPPSLPRDDQGHIVAGEDTETVLPGVYAAGDIRPKKLRQLTTAVADGSTAAMAAEHFIQEHFA
ncbi:MAG: thioredoxin-disulfide reductase [Clostridia bacterium]|nr:thioredoxin-disulfide reductase [Clostridia bacterium]